MVKKMVVHLTKRNFDDFPRETLRTSNLNFLKWQNERDLQELDGAFFSKHLMKKEDLAKCDNSGLTWKSKTTDCCEVLDKAACSILGLPFWDGGYVIGQERLHVGSCCWPTTKGVEHVKLASLIFFRQNIVGDTLLVLYLYHHSHLHCSGVGDQLPAQGSHACVQ